MLSETIMHECIMGLLKSATDEKSLECFAVLITETGKDLDHPEAKVCSLPLSLLGGGGGDSSLQGKQIRCTQKRNTKINRLFNEV